MEESQQVVGRLLHIMTDEDIKLAYDNHQDNNHCVTAKGKCIQEQKLLQRIKIIHMHGTET